MLQLGCRVSYGLIRMSCVLWFNLYPDLSSISSTQQSFRVVFRKRGPENMQQIYRRTPMLKWDHTLGQGVLL